jgi:hypothetical protein
MTLPHQAHHLAQQIYMPGQQVVTLSLQQVNGKEIGTTRMPGASIVRHAIMMRKISDGAMRFAS